jgi:hypothetical protein
MTDLDVNVLVIISDEVLARLSTTEDFAEKFCASQQVTSRFTEDSIDYVVVSRGDEILWIVDGMRDGIYQKAHKTFLTDTLN